MSLELYTENDLKYHYYPVVSNLITFRVKAAHDAHTILIGPTGTQNDKPPSPCYEIFFGGWKNTQSVIRKNLKQPEKAEAMTPNILNPNEYKGFWIRWDSDVLTAGVQGDANPILKYQDSEMFPIKVFGFCTGWGATGHWIIDYTPIYSPSHREPGFDLSSYPGVGFSQPKSAFRWIPSAAGIVPPNAIVGGYDKNGDTLYVMRARHEGTLTLGTLIKSKNVACVWFGGYEQPKQEYEVLCDFTPQWLAATGGNELQKAFPARQTEKREPMDVDGVNNDGASTSGKLKPSDTNRVNDDSALTSGRVEPSDIDRVNNDGASISGKFIHNLRVRMMREEHNARMKTQEEKLLAYRAKRRYYELKTPKNSMFESE